MEGYLAHASWLVALAFAACGGASVHATSGSGHAASDRPNSSDAARAEPEPTQEALATTYASTEPEDVMEGEVSYYHNSLAGNLTANGERYRLDRFTAASPDLPFGTILRVERVDNGRSVVVRVNDRGPFGDNGRLLDLSRAAARQLDMLRAGVVRVRIEILERGDGRTFHRRRR